MEHSPRNNVQKVVKCMTKQKVKIAKRMLRYKGILPYSQELADWLDEYEQEEIKVHHRDKTNSALKIFNRKSSNDAATK